MLKNLQIIPWNNLKVGDLLGHGGYGDVYKAEWHGAAVAIKQLHLKTLPTHLQEEFTHEAEVMAQCQFPHIVGLYGICQEIGHNGLVMEYMPKGSLYGVLHNKDETLSWDIRFEIAIDIGKGISYLHSKNILHRDLKSLNVLLGNDYHAKLCDFGLSKIKLESNSTSTESKASTVRWRAPETFKRQYKPTSSMDIYSYGMVLWEIAARVLPFSDAPDELTVISWIKDGEKEIIPSSDCPKAYGTIIQETWQDAENRPNAKKIIMDLTQNKPETKPEILEKSQKMCVEKSGDFDFEQPLFSQSITSSLNYLPGEAEYMKGMEYHLRFQNMEARSYFITAVEQNYPAAYLRIADSCSDRRLPKLVKKCGSYYESASINIDWFKKQAERGTADAQYNLGFCYEQGLGVTKDKKLAVQYYKLAANQEYALAQYKLGVCYSDGRGIPKDNKLAVKYYQLAANQGCTEAQYYLGDCYYAGEGGVPQDYKLAVKYYQLVADCLGNSHKANAEYKLGICYANGLGVTQNYKLAVTYYQLVADDSGWNAHKADAEYNLGLCYEKGLGVFKDDKLAVKYYQLAADQGNAAAQNNLGNCYYNGQGVAQDYKLAVKYYQLAADQGHEKAKAALKKYTSQNVIQIPQSFFQSEKNKSQEEKVNKNSSQNSPEYK